jgi:hypothetical protein
LPTTLNDDKNVVALFKVVVPDTFNNDIYAVILFYVGIPEIFALY